MLILPIQVSERFPIGTVIEAYAPPDDDWLLCDGQVLAQADYPTLYSLMDDPHPTFKNWEVIDNGLVNGLYEVVYGLSLWVGCGSSGKMAYSSDGATWTPVTLSSYTNLFAGINFDGTTFVSVADGSTPITNYVTSTNGTSWTERSLPTAIEGHAVAYDGTNFYLISYDDGLCLYSANGTSWSSGGSLPDTTFYGCAASPDKVVTISYGGILAVSDDAISTWKYYSAPIAYPMEITYDSVGDQFVLACNSDGVYAVSPGDDGVNWDIRNLPISEVGSIRHYGYTYPQFVRIRKAGSYWFACSWYGQQIAFSEDLVTWRFFPSMNNEWYDAYYNSSTGYYYIVGSGGYSMRWKEVDQYVTGTHFMLPMAHDQYDWARSSKKRKYIRVK